MPNYCDYQMKIKGSKETIQRVVDCLNADYNYGEGKPEHKHFFRVFQCEENDFEDNGDGTFTKFVYGYCAWSVWSCMMEGDHTYFKDLSERFGNEMFMGTCLREQSQDCEIEVFSEETEGMFFSEHYYFKNGECLVNDDEKISYRENKYGELIIKNPHRYKKTEDFLWEID